MVKRNTKKWFRHGAWWKRLFLDRRYKDVIFMKMKNDLSFIIGSHLQSHGCLHREGNPERYPDQRESGGTGYAFDRI